MSRLRVLITNTWLDARGGSELYVRDLALSLLARGHTPIVYSPVLGAVARELRLATIPVIDDLGALGAAPDVIHAHHNLETLTALMRLPGVPAVAFCHGWLPWQEAPPSFPRIRRYVAVDNTCRDRLVFEHGIPEERARVLLNFVDLERFAPRAPLPERPARALLFNNGASERTHLPAVREACGRVGLSLDVIGLSAGRVADAPEALLGGYDVVFAKARAALEALAVGSAVVLCDALGAGPLVTSAEFDRLRALNFGIRTLRAAVTAEHLEAELARYDAADAARVSLRVRTEAGREAAVDELVEIYREVIAEQRAAGPDDQRAEATAAAVSVRRIGDRFRAETQGWDRAVAALEADRARLGETVAQALAEVGRLRQNLVQAETETARQREETVAALAECARFEAACGAAQAACERAVEARNAAATELARARHELACLNASTTVRLRDQILATPGIGGLVQLALRVGKRSAAMLRSIGPT